MRFLRFVPPVRSPITLPSVVAGFSAAMRKSAAQEAHSSVESQLRAMLGNPGMLLTNSGTSALALALRHSANGRGASRPVALPAYGCYDLATAVDAADVPFILYDVDPVTLGPDWSSLRNALKTGADRVVIVHLYGIPVDMSEMSALAAQFGAFVIEDAAQGVGGAWRGAVLGSIGSLGVLSFGRGKGVTAGHGGALLANDDLGMAVMNGLKSIPVAPSTVLEAGAFIAQWLMARPLVYGIPASMPFLRLGETAYRPPEAARQLSRFSAGALSKTLALVDAENNRRRENALLLASRLDLPGIQQIQIPRGGDAGYLRFPVTVNERSRAAAHRQPARRLGVMPGYPTSLASLRGFGNRQTGPRRPDLPGARELEKGLVTLPTHGALSMADLVALEDWCRAQQP